MTLSTTRLRRSVRDRFEDFAPLVTEQDTTAFGQLPMNQRAEFVRRFWSENDPDLVTPENEAQLEYWARVAQAYFLFYDPARREWDERGDIYVRYGPPQAATYALPTEWPRRRFGFHGLSHAYAARDGSICSVRSIAAQPSTALMGVRSSCDTVARNSSLARLADCASR